jgi:nucleoside-diphosphate-sugar epimerase
LEFIRADIRDENFAQHLADCTAVVHCAFLVTSNAPEPVFRSINIEGSKNVFRAAVAAGVETVVYLSSIMAYGSVPGHPVPIKEDTPRIYQPAFPYAACKFEVEAFMDEFEVAHPEVAICRLRPNILLGRNVPHLLGWLLRRNWVPSFGGAPLAIVSDEDVADLVMLALEQRARGPYNAAADDLRTAEQLAKEFDLYVLNVWKPFVLAYAALDWCLKKIGFGLPYDAAWVTRLEGISLVASSARAKSELGWSPRYPTASAVLEHFRAIAPRRLDFRLYLVLKLLKREGRQAGPELVGRSARVHLCVTGEFGEDYSLLLSEGRISFRSDPPEFPTSAIIVSSSTFCRLLARQVDIESAHGSGSIVFEGNRDGRMMLGWIVATFGSICGGRGLRGSAARTLARWLAR